MIKRTIMLGALSMAIFAGTAEARDQIRIVGSSTVYPFATAVAENFGKTTKFKTPVIESTGSGGGLKLFCAGAGLDTPDITNASRAIKASEVKLCAKNGVKDITEVKIGYDGIVLANSRNAPVMKITRKQLFLALAKDIPNGKGGLQANPNKTWHDVDPSLPNVKIEVMGPPPTSGTRDAWAELAMEHGCKQYKWIKAIKHQDKKRYKAICHSLREDGAYIEAGENDVLIVRKLEANKNAFGIFGFSYLEQNSDKIQGALVNGSKPTFENISDGSYPLSRPLFFYVKKAHVDAIPGIKQYLAEFTSEKAWGNEGYLADKGMIPMPDAERKKYRSIVQSLKNNIM